MKNIAIVTGATGGLGEEFARHLVQRADIDEIWAVGRSEEKLSALAERQGEKIKSIRCELSDRADLETLVEAVNAADVCIKYLVNNAGVAKMARYGEFAAREIESTIDVNCTAPLVLCRGCMAKMGKGSRILNISSASSFQPNPYIALYSATKVLLKNFSRAFNYEIKKTGVTCTAVCPGWVDTDMLRQEKNGKKVRFPGMVSAERVVKKALRDADRGKDMSVCSLYVKYEHLFSKLMPNKLVMKIWAKGVEKYL